MEPQGPRPRGTGSFPLTLLCQLRRSGRPAIAAHHHHQGRAGDSRHVRAYDRETTGRPPSLLPRHRHAKTKRRLRHSGRDLDAPVGLERALQGTGNGGFAGNISYGALAEGLRRGYAVANTDMGMATPPGATASIFINRPERWIDWGYRATHEMTLVAKQIVRAYYARDARHSYFIGCSTGGEQALMESQRYPDDYDGIVGGAAANNRTGVHVSILWNFAVNERTPASYLPADARSLLSHAVVNACDALDGVKDGMIADPTKCHFDPASLQCKQPDQENCLTAAQVETVKEIYAGPVNPRTGESLYPGLPRGSEFGWDGLDPTPGPAAIPPFAPIFQWVFGPDWDWRQFDFDHQDTVFTQKLAGMVNATSPDIDTFRAHGHKLLIYHGWSDWLVAPGESINY